MTETPTIETLQTEVQELRAMHSVLVDRHKFASSAGLQFGGSRDIWTALGYKVVPQFRDYCEIYKRQDVAGRVIDQPIRATWREIPLLIDTDHEKTESAFEKAWTDLVARHRIIDRFKRVDTLASLGRYAALFVGLAGQDDFAQPLISRAAGPEGLLYLTPFSEDNTTIDRYDDDRTSPRFGWPVEYSLQTQTATGKVTSQQSFTAHWSRVVHVTQGNLENDILGTPYLERVINLLDDLLKVVGGSAETYWMLAKSPLHANLDPKARPLGEAEKKEVKEQVDEIQHSLRRVLYSSGLNLSYLSSAVADPRGPFEVIIKLISAATGIPQRVLMGAEAGELASTQDDKNFADRVQERQTDYAEPKILRPTADLLIEAGVLPEPQGGEYDVTWGSLADPDEAERAETTDKWASAAQKFGNARHIIAPEEVRERYFGLPAENPNPPEDPIEQAEESTEDEGEEGDEDDSEKNNNN